MGVVLWCPHHHHQCFFLEAAVMGMQVNSRVDWGWPMTGRRDDDLDYCGEAVEEI